MLFKNLPLNLSFIHSSGLYFMFFVFIGCQFDVPPVPEIEIVELVDYTTIIAFEDEILATPTVMRYDGQSHLFVYDKSAGNVLELDGNGEVVREYGRRGLGPGEFMSINNIFVNNDHV